MTTKPGNRTALMPQASRALPPNQNGHHASPAMNAHSSARSTMAPLAETLFVLEIPAIYASEFETGYHTLAVKIGFTTASRTKVWSPDKRGILIGAVSISKTRKKSD